MAKTIAIEKGILPFDDRMDTSRNNPDRKTWGKSDNAKSLYQGGEYDEPLEPEVLENKPAEPPAPPVPEPAPPQQKFTHKLANGTVLEAESVEALAAKIEQSFNQAAKPADVQWDDAPVYKPLEFKRRELTIQEKADLLNQWAKDPQQANRALQEAEYGVTMGEILERLNRSEVREMQRSQEVAGVEFLEEYADLYRATPANAKKLTEYLKQQNKPITKNNLVKAFRALSEADATMLREQTPEPPEQPEEQPPTIIASNQGNPPPLETPSIDVEKFKRMSLENQKKYFLSVRR